MIEKQNVIDFINTAFGENEYPGDYFLQGSYEGNEPGEEVTPFTGKTKWQEVEASFLDRHSAALSFFSEAGFRFYLPAYLIADLRDELDRADPLFHLTHGFSDEQVEQEVNGRVFVLRTGKSVLLNPRRYGASTFYDYARYQLSIFTREEAGAIAAYLKYKQENTDLEIEAERIQAALDLFWNERAEQAPTAEDLRQYIAEQMEYIEAIRKQS